MRQQFGPAQSRLGVPWYTVNAAGDLVEPALEVSAPPSRWKQQDTEAHFPQDHGIDCQVAFVTPQPLDHPHIRTRPGRLAQHIGVDKTRHGSDPSESVDSDSIGANQQSAVQPFDAPRKAHSRCIASTYDGSTTLPRHHQLVYGRAVGPEMARGI